MKTLVTFFIILALSFSTVNAQWFEVSTPTQSLYAVYFVNADIGWACGYDSTIIKTTDGGNSWIFQSSPVGDRWEIIQFVNKNFGWIRGWNKLIKTTNGGTNWSEVVLPFSFSDFFFISPTTGWITSQNNLPNRDSEIFKTTDGGLSWTSQFFSMDEPLGTIFFLNENYGWVFSFNGFVVKTNNGGLNWTPNYTAIFPQAWDISFVDTLTGWFATNTLGSYDILKTTDSGDTWFSQMGEIYRNIESIKFLNSSIGYAAVSAFGFPGTPGRGIIKKTTDGGNTWTEQYSEPGALHSISMVDELVGYAAGGKLLKTVNGGLPVELVSFSAERNDNDVMLSWTTASETNNKGFEVERSIQNSKLKIKNFEPIGFVNGNGTSTELNYYSFKDETVSVGNYIYRLKQIDFDGSYEYSTEIEVEIGMPDEFVLYQNYPNPFNPTTAIKYSVPQIINNQSSIINLKIYDVLGNEIATLVNEEKPPGVYEVEFNASHLASGMYVYKITVGNPSAGSGQAFIQAKKMLMMK